MKAALFYSTNSDFYYQTLEVYHFFHTQTSISVVKFCYYHAQTPTSPIV